MKKLFEQLQRFIFYHDNCALPKAIQTHKAAFLVLTAVTLSSTSFGQLWKQYADSAKAFQEQTNLDRAVELYSKARVELKKDAISTSSHAAVALSLANLYRNMGQYDNAEPLYLEAKQIWEKVLGTENPDYAASCNSLAVLYLIMGQHKKAAPLMVEAKQIRENVLGKEHPDYAGSCNNLAILYRDLGQYKKAEALYSEAQQIRENVLGKQHPDYAGSCNNLAILYNDMGQHEKAEELYIEALKILENLRKRKDRDYAAWSVNLAGVYMDMGQYEKAEPLYLEAMHIQETQLGKQHPQYATTTNNLGLLYWQMGQYEKAEDFYLQSMQIWDKTVGKQHPEYAGSCGNLARLYMDMGQYAKAEALNLEAKQIKEKMLGKQHPHYANSCNDLADFYKHTEAYEKSASLYLEARQIRKKVLGKEHPSYAMSCNNLALLYYTIGKIEKAELLFLEAKHILQKTFGKQNLHYGSSCNNLAKVYWRQSKLLQAEKEFSKSFAVTAYNVSSVFQFTSQKEKAAFIQNISGKDDDAYSFYLSTKLRSKYPYSLSLFHRNLILSSSEALKKQLFYTYNTTLTTKYNDWLNLKRYLSVLYSKPVEVRKEDVAKLEEKASQLEKELTKLSLPFSKQQQRIDWKNIQNKLKANEACIEFVSFNFNNGKRRTDTILYAALVLRKDCLLPALVGLFNEKQLTSLLSVTNNTDSNDGAEKLYSSRGVVVGQNNSNSNTNTSKSIYDLIWKPLEKHLYGIKRVYFAPSGMLYRIAFAALPMNSKQILSDKYKLVQLATTASVANLHPSFVTTSDRVQLYGGIDYYNVDTTTFKHRDLTYRHHWQISRSLPADLTRSGEWRPLPGTKKETEEIVAVLAKNKMKVTFTTSSDATEESLKALDGKASPAVLHIATHGFFFPDPKQNRKQPSAPEMGKAFKLSDDPLMRSGLLFAGANHAWQNKPIEEVDDGILTAYEVSNMYLPNTKLLVLSACETGLGDIQGNEGVYGLQRAFKLAGVENIIMSLESS